MSSRWEKLRSSPARSERSPEYTAREEREKVPTQESEWGPWITYFLFHLFLNHATCWLFWFIGPAAGCVFFLARRVQAWGRHAFLRPLVARGPDSVFSEPCSWKGVPSIVVTSRLVGGGSVWGLNGSSVKKLVIVGRRRFGLSWACWSEAQATWLCLNQTCVGLR